VPFFPFGWGRNDLKGGRKRYMNCALQPGYKWRALFLKNKGKKERKRVQSSGKGKSKILRVANVKPLETEHLKPEKE